MGVETPLPSAGQERFFYGGLGGDSKVSSHEVKEDGVDTKLPQKVRMTVE